MGIDARQYGGGALRPEDVDGPQVERVIAVTENAKYNCLSLELESGAQLLCWPTINRTLTKAWGYDTDGWIGQELEVSRGSYMDKKTDPPTEKPTIEVRPISPRKPNAGSSVAVRPRTPPLRDEMEDDIPY